MAVFPIPKEQWDEILRNKAIIGPVWGPVLLSFYFMPGHRASCKQCSDAYNHNCNVYNSGITALGIRLNKEFGPFSLDASDNDKGNWRVAMSSGQTLSDGTYEWQMRHELVEAIEDWLIEDFTRQYIKDFDKHWPYERYKWRAVKCFKEHWNPNSPNLSEMIERSMEATDNLLASRNSFPLDMLVKMAKAAPVEVREMLINLYDESIDLAKRVQRFMDRAEAVRVQYNPGNWDSHYQNTNAISTYLWLRYPDKYYIYKYSEYLKVSAKLGLGYKIRKGGVSEMITGYRMYDRINEALNRSDELRRLMHDHLDGHLELYPDPQLRTATIDFGFWVSRWAENIVDSLKLKNSATMSPFISSALGLLKAKKNLILQGAPGTGKTYNTASIAVALIDGNASDSHADVMARYDELKREGRIGFVTFHQSMDYEDFIEGIKPASDGTTVRYDVEEGIFKRLCNAAKKAEDESEYDEKPYVMIIDEINRGNVSKIFGELITLLEKDKRLGAEHPITLTLPYSKADFGIPQNLYIIGTMNTTDRSTGTLDYALRRRFCFITTPADREKLDDETSRCLFDNVQELIHHHKYADMDLEDLMVGHSYFMANTEDELALKVEYEIIPLVKEYIKDGILNVKPAEAKKYFDAWRKLEAYDHNDSGAQ